jgi:BON domain
MVRGGRPTATLPVAPAVTARGQTTLDDLPATRLTGPGEGARVTRSLEVSRIKEDDTVVVRARHVLAAAVGLAVSHLTPAQEPGPIRLDSPAQAAATANQQTADAVARQLKQSGRLQRYHIDITFRAGTAELTGTVGDHGQREEAIRLAQGVPGVESVVDRLTVPGDPAVRQAQLGQAPPMLKAPTPDNVVPGPDAPGGAMPEPAPSFAALPANPTDLNPPKMPPYAWPTYAPYNNFSRVAYPEAYPYNAWPFIGPVYPFPKIPLGWRCVKLEWEDGHWWYSRVATRHDWWRLKYW